MFSHGDEATLLDRYAVYRASRTQVSGSKLPNAWGLFDMHGNVREWCQDWFDAYGSLEAVTGPMGATQGISRVLRGGSFFNVAVLLRSARRGRSLPGTRDGVFGFRVARTYP